MVGNTRYALMARGSYLPIFLTEDCTVAKKKAAPKKAAKKAAAPKKAAKKAAKKASKKAPVAKKA